MAGEFYVMEVLYRLGHQPALTLENAKMVDILVQTASGRTLSVSVKTVRGGGKWGVDRTNLTKRRNLVFVFLIYEDFTDVTTRPQAYVVPAPAVQQLKERWFESYAVYFSNKDRRARLERYRDGWHVFES
jgi:hypothetical protein